jgi:hypothetical protein
MTQTAPANPIITTNPPSPGIVPSIPQPGDLFVEIDSDEVTENEMQAWKIQSIEHPSLAKSQFQEDMQRRLEEVRQEAEEAYTSDAEIDQIPPSAYKEASLLLDMLLDHDLPMPHIGWAEDGSLGFEWRPEGGIATMGIYGDNLVIYGVFFEKNRQVDGVCPLSDTALLGNFLETLRQIL